MTQSGVKALERRECERLEGERESKPTSGTVFHSGGSF